MAVLPTHRLLGLSLGVAVPLAAASLDSRLFYIAAISLVGVVVLIAVDLRLAPSATTFEVERRHDQRLSLGEPNPVDLHVRWVGPRRGARALRLWMRDETPTELPVDRRILSGQIVPGDTWTGRYHLRPLRRGDFRFGAIVLRVQGPLGLTIRQHSYSRSAPARVYPNLRAVHRYDLLLRRGRLHEAGLRRARLRGQGTEFERLRDYLPDDDFRRIAWKATARRHQPVTVEYETERSQNLIVLIDTGRLMGTPVGAMEKLDYAVNATLMLAYVAAGLGDRIGLMAFADRVEAYVPPGRGRRQFHLILESLYRLRALPVESNPARALAYLATRQPRRSLVILLTDLVEANEAETLVSHLGQLARRHLPLCVTISDPDLIRLAAESPTNSRRAYERVVAQRLLDERRVILDRLERRGALALDVPAEQLTVAIIDRYLEIKARTRL